MRITIKEARLSFPVLWTPEQFQGEGTPRYGCALLIAKDDPQVKAIKAAIHKAGEEKFGEKWKDTQWRKGLKNNGFRDGDEKEYDGYAGHYFISANRSEKQGPPKIVDRFKGDDGRFVQLAESDGRPYGGCYVNASVEFYGDSRYGKAINCSLIALQYVRDGESFAGGSRFVEDDFEDLGQDPATAISSDDDDDDDDLI